MTDNQEIEAAEIQARKEFGVNKMTIEKRMPSHVRNYPLAGDVLELAEKHSDPVSGETFETDTMIRVVAVHEGRVWLKQYDAAGHQLMLISKWQERFDKAIRSVLIRGADHDAPF